MHGRNVSPHRQRAIGEIVTRTDVLIPRFGGSGTTANTFIYALWGVISDPSIAQRLHSEIDEAFPDPNTVPDSLVSQLFSL